MSSIDSCLWFLLSTKLNGHVCHFLNHLFGRCKCKLQGSLSNLSCLAPSDVNNETGSAVNNNKYSLYIGFGMCKQGFLIFKKMYIR
jgi:hypothetical protein